MTGRWLHRMRSRRSGVLRKAVGRLWSVSDAFARRLLGVTLLFLLAGSAMTALAPVLLKLLIDGLDPDLAVEVYALPALLVFAYAITHWLSRSLAELRAVAHGRADQRLQNRLSQKLFEHVISLPFSFHVDRQTGALTQTLTNGLLGYRMVLYHFTNTVLPATAELATMGVVLLLLNHSDFLLIIAVSMILYIIAFWRGARQIGRPAQGASEAHIDATAMLTDSILNYEAVKCFSAEPQVHRRFVKALVRTEDKWAKLFGRKMENGLVVAAIFALSLGLSLYVAARKVQLGSMTIGEFVLVNTYVIRLTQPLEMIGFAFRDIVQGTAFIGKMTEIFNLPRELEVFDSGTTLPPGPAELKFENVSFSYHPNRTILKDINFTALSGKTLAIVGASGSGKSSLIRLLLRFCEPAAGQILLDGTPLSEIPVDNLRKSIALVPQDTALFNDTISYNIGLAKPGCSDGEIIQAAKVAHIHEFIMQQQNGYETMVGERGLKLSGGEKQRIAIARAALKDSRIFVFDEATSSLDSRTERAILRKLIIATKTTTLIVAHRLSTIVHADNIIVLNQGTVIEHGNHSVLLRNNGIYSAMWRAQRSVTTAA